MSKFFIRRPIVAIVIAIVTVLGGLVAMRSLPIAQFPDIVPPQITVTATYNGADALTIERRAHAVGRADPRRSRRQTHRQPRQRGTASNRTGSNGVCRDAAVHSR